MALREFELAVEEVNVWVNTRHVSLVSFAASSRPGDRTTLLLSNGHKVEVKGDARAIAKEVESDLSNEEPDE